MLSFSEKETTPLISCVASTSSPIIALPIPKLGPSLSLSPSSVIPPLFPTQQLSLYLPTRGCRTFQVILVRASKYSYCELFLALGADVDTEAKTTDLGCNSLHKLRCRHVCARRRIRRQQPRKCQSLPWDTLNYIGILPFVDACYFIVVFMAESLLSVPRDPPGCERSREAGIDVGRGLTCTEG